MPERTSEPAPDPKRLWRHLCFALILSALIVIPRAILIQENHSEASDDDYHLVRGLEFLRLDRGLVHRELNDPPLGEALAALPLWLMGGTTHGPDEGTAIHGQPRYSAETALAVVAAWKSVLFLPLIAVAFLWCARLYGLASAWLAAGLLVVEPTITGHLHLASLDVIATTGIVTACYLGWRYFERPSNPRLLAAAIACAAALLIKHTAIIVPLMLCLYALLAWLRQEVEWPARRVMFGVIRGGIVTLMVMWVLLGFDSSGVRKGRTWPLGLYLESALDAARHVREPNDAYLSGEIRRGGWWYYFPVVATYKVPIGITALLLAGVASITWRRPRWAEWGLVIPAVGYTAFMLSQNINIGWRHFLPAYVFLMLLATRLVAAGTVLAWRTFAAAALLFTAVDVSRWYPDYIPYINWPRRDVHLAISDSNVDWGQGLKQVERWLEQNEAFVAGRPVYLRGYTVRRRAVIRYLGGRVTQKYAGYPTPRSGVLIISPVAISGVSESQDEYAYLRGIPPHAIIGHGLRVYDLDALAKEGRLPPGGM